MHKHNNLQSEAALSKRKNNSLNLMPSFNKKNEKCDRNLYQEMPHLISFEKS